MQEYTINVREDGTAVIARNKWNPDHSMEAMDNKPFLFEVGQKVVDIFSNVVTIKEIIKHKPSKPGCCPEWDLLVEENGNCYRYTEIAGIYVREVSAVELLTLTKEDSLGLGKDLEEHLTWFLREYYNYDYPKQYKEGTGSSAMPHIVEAAIHFASWQKQQMMKDAVIMEAHEEYGELWGDIRKCNTEKNKKYKVIIIKEE